MKILLAVSGSISAYKANDLIRHWIKDNHEVKVILTHGAQKFVVKETFSYLGAREVFLSGDDFQDYKGEFSKVLHVDLVKWADRFVIAPLTANTLSRLARGEASDLLSSCFLSYPTEKPLLLYPAMNTHMLENPLTQMNLDEVKKLRNLKNLFIHPTLSGELACGDEGKGKLPSPEEIAHQTIAFYLQKKDSPKTLITSGATLSFLDPIRYITNPSSGKTGFFLARSLLSKGHQVDLVVGEKSCEEIDFLAALPGCRVYRIVSTRDMHRKVMELIEQISYSLFIASAAPCDIEFEFQDSKVSKDHLSESLPIRVTPDILKTVLDSPQKPKKVIGFAASDELDERLLKEKFEKKPVDLLVGTKAYVLKGEIQGFQNSRANYLIYNGEYFQMKELDKRKLAEILFKEWQL